MPVLGWRTFDGAFSDYVSFAQVPDNDDTKNRALAILQAGVDRVLN